MKSIVRKLLAFQKNPPHISKKCVANMGNRSYKYADLAGVLDAITPALNALGLVLTQSIDGEFLKTSIIDAESGESIESNFPINFQSMTWHQIGSAVSYSRRYAILALTGMTADDDDDATSISNEKAKADQHELCHVCGDEMRLSKSGSVYCYRCWTHKRNGYASLNHSMS